MARPGLGVTALLAGLTALGIVILVGSGWRGLLVYAFLVALAAGLAFGTRVGGDWLRGASRGRFERGDRH